MKPAKKAEKPDMKTTDRKILEAMIEQMNASTARADAALDRALAFIAESEKRIAVMAVTMPAAQQAPDERRPLF